MDERGNIKIEEKGNCNFDVEIKLINGTVWLSQNEIARLFNVFVSKVNSNIRSIYKNGFLEEEETAKFHHYIQKGKEYTVIFYNLKVLIHLSYRINSTQAKVFRNWIETCFYKYQENELKQPEIKLYFKYPNNTNPIRN